jgi:hypothetical protein
MAPSKQNQDPLQPHHPQTLSYTLPKWPQPQGIFTNGTTFHPIKFLANIRELYERVVVEKGSGDMLMEHEAFADLLAKRLVVLEDGSVLFKLFDVDLAPATPDSLVVVHDGDNYLRVDCLR